MHKKKFPKKKKKYVCLPYLNFLKPLPETHLFFYLALLVTWEFLSKSRNDKFLYGMVSLCHEISKVLLDSYILVGIKVSFHSLKKKNSKLATTESRGNTSQ